MKRRFIIINVNRDGSLCEPLSVDHASFEQLSAVLSLLRPGDEMSIRCCEEDDVVMSPLSPGVNVNS